MSKQRIQVSDWSQPIKIVLMVLFFAGAIVFGVRLITIAERIKLNTAVKCYEVNAGSTMSTVVCSQIIFDDR